MNKALILASALLLAATTAAYADQARAQPASLVGRLQSQTPAVGPRQTQRPTPLFTVGNLAVGIWAPVRPPYDASANRNLAAINPW